MGKENTEEGYWESEDYSLGELTCDVVINAVFESGAPGNANFLTVASENLDKPFKIIVAWGDDWYIKADEDDDEEEYKL